MTMNYRPENFHTILRTFLIFCLILFNNLQAMEQTSPVQNSNNYAVLIFSIFLLLLVIIIVLIINFRKRLRAEKALKVSESRLNLALNATNDGIWDWNISTGQVYYSPRWLEIIGYSENQIDDNMLSWQKLIHSDDLDYVVDKINAHLKGDSDAFDAEYRMADSKGEWRWILDRGRIVEWDTAGKPLRMIGSHQDITQRKNFEVRLYENERKFRGIVESSSDGIALIDQNGIIIEWNKGFEKITGIPQRDAVGKYQWDIQSEMLSNDHPKKPYTEQFKEDVKASLKKGKAPWLNRLMEIEILCRDGSKKTVQQLVFPVKTKSGFMAGSITRDITEFKKTEEALRESERKFRELSDMLPQTVFETDLNGFLTFANSIAYEQFGFEKDEDIYKLNVLNTIIPEDRDRAKKNIERSLRNERFVEEYTAVRKDGTKFPVLIHSTPVSNNNTVIGLRGIIIDITEMKRSEEAVVESEAKYRTLIETQSEGVILLDLNENITFSNPSANLIFGLEDNSLTGRNLKEFTSEEQFNKVISYSKERLEGVKSVFELDILRPDGTPGCIHFTITPYKDKSGIIIGGFAVFSDITQRKKSEADLIKAKEEAERSSKLKTEFLAQVSHEIRTPINSILSFTSLLKDELEDKIPEDLKSSFRIIENGGRRLIRTIDLILNMSQIQTGTYEGNIAMLDLEKDVLDGVILEFLPAIKEKNLEYSFNNNNVTKKIVADQYTVMQIFTNLIDNAIKYTPKGKIDIQLGHCNNEIIVKISDTGIGISKEYLPHLFAAFSQEESGYTRRFDGNGLGLALVKKYCELNDARIEVKSEKGSGSIFSVFFKTAH